MMLPHIAGRVFDAPLLLYHPKLDTILSVLGQRIGLRAEQLPVDSIEPSATQDMPVPGIAVIPVCGTLVKRTVGLEAQSGLVSYSSIATQITAAIADPCVSAILLDIDSSGGESGGCFDLADFIYASRGSKPIWAIANDSCFSAAYAIASAADKVFVTRTGGVGSIGVIALHVDQSVADQQDGLAYTAIFAGAKKNDLSPHVPLTSNAQASLQTEVNRIYGLFCQTVARNRKCSADFIRGTDAGLFFGGDAVTAGLADGVASLSEALIQIQSAVPTPGVTPAISPTKENTMSQNEAPPLKAEATPGQPNFTDAVEIAQLCQIAGVPDKTAEYLASGKTVAQVRYSLLEARAAHPTISSHIDPLAQPGAAAANVVMNAVKRRIAGGAK